MNYIFEKKEKHDWFFYVKISHRKESEKMEVTTAFFFGLIIVTAFIVKHMFLKNHGMSPFDSYMIQTLENIEWWNLKSENNCEYWIKVSFDENNLNRAVVSAFDYVGKTKYNYLLTRCSSLPNRVKRLGVEKICFGKVGLP